MGLFQKAYDLIKGFKTPYWYKVWTVEIQNLIISIMVQVGKEYILQLQNKILEVSKYDISGKEKFKLVFELGKDLLPQTKDSALNLLIENLFNRLKIKKAV